MYKVEEIYSDCVSGMHNLPEEQRLVFVESCNKMVVTLMDKMDMDSVANTMTKKVKTIVKHDYLYDTVTVTDTLRDTAIVEIINTKKN